MSLCAITSLIGVVITATVQLIQNHKVDFGWPLVRLGDLICYSVLVISHRSPSFNIDCMYRFFAHFSRKNTRTAISVLVIRSTFFYSMRATLEPLINKKMYVVSWKHPEVYQFFLRTCNDLDAQGGAIGGVCVSFNGWAMKKRGPVLVSVFSPIATVISVVFSVIAFGDRINLGRYC